MSKDQNRIIIIAGDSWGCGEWNHGDYGYHISHGGLTKYLSDLGYQVINLSYPGGSNLTSAERVVDFLTVSKHLNVSHVFVFQTEWVRDLKFLDSTTTTKYLNDGYSSFKSKIISKFYYSLSDASQQANVPIHLIGGCSDTIWLDKFSVEYPGLNVVCQSMVNLLLESTHRITNPVDCIWTSQHVAIVKYIREHIKTDELPLMLEDIEKGQTRANIWSNNTCYFWPDGLHANQESHRILFEHIKTQISNL